MAKPYWQLLLDGEATELDRRRNEKVTADYLDERRAASSQQVAIIAAKCAEPERSATKNNIIRFRRKG